jgi:hypothetical protein
MDFFSLFFSLGHSIFNACHFPNISQDGRKLLLPPSFPLSFLQAHLRGFSSDILKVPINNFPSLGGRGFTLLDGKRRLMKAESIILSNRVKGRGPRCPMSTPTLTLPRRGGGLVEEIPNIFG